jgi:hypothetical protein
MPIGMSRSVRESDRPAAAPLNPLKLSRAEATMVGTVRASVMSPAARTAPAPMYRM